jgi:hypothetical protein
MRSPNVYLVYHGSIASHERAHGSCSVAKASAKLKSAKQLFSGHAIRKGKALNGAQRWTIETFGMAKGTFHVSGIIDDGNQS